MKPLKRLPIRSKITLLSFGVVLFSLVIGGIIIIGYIMSLKEEELGKRAMITARTVAQLPEIKNDLSKSEGWKRINPMVERIRVINNVDYVVVLNMDKIRYSHPIDSMLGKKSTSQDEDPAFANNTYLSKSKGILGTAIRAFVPILNKNQEQIGVVLVGEILPSMSQMIFGLRKEIFIIVFLTMLFGVLGSWLLARQIKKETFQLEPHEIARLLVERTATFHAMHEGIIAIDNQANITIFNDKAKKMLKVTKDVIGEPIREVISNTRLPEVLRSGIPLYNKELRVGQTIILSNRVPIRVDNQTVGAVAIFQDRTEFTKLAEELTGVRAFVDALRVQNHEHMNKLHTIAGLIQLGHQEQALSYIFQTFDEQKELTRFLNKNIFHDQIKGLLLSKVSRGKELGVDVQIDRYSKMHHFPKHLDHHDFVIILGNLIENAFESGEREHRWIKVSINQNDELFELLVEDNGDGIQEKDLKEIYREGFTTKRNGNGIGLYLIKEIVKKGKGDIQVVSEWNEGTRFLITFPMNEGG